MLRNGNDENFKAKESLRGKCLGAPARKQTAVMKKQLTTRANSYEFFSKKSPQSTNDSTRIVLVAAELAFPENIGSLIRIAGNIGCEKVIFTGEQSNFKSKKIQRLPLTMPT
jgi:tRNA G18 (ribose-2'-O)-methylase SpoU